MSQRDNFIGGFFLGTILGGAVGGVLGVLVASRLSSQDASSSEESFSKLKGKAGKSKQRQFQAPTEQSIEAARRGLEDKIAQLNDAIDDVRQQLSSVNGSSKEDGERAIAQD